MEFSRLNIDDYLKEKIRQEKRKDTADLVQAKAFIGSWREANDHEIYNEFIY